MFEDGEDDDEEHDAEAWDEEGDDELEAGGHLKVFSDENRSWLKPRTLPGMDEDSEEEPGNRCGRGMRDMYPPGLGDEKHPVSCRAAATRRRRRRRRKS
jgi:hypothetical protein